MQKKLVEYINIIVILKHLLLFKKKFNNSFISPFVKLFNVLLRTKLMHKITCKSLL